jgi:hypothetical protein
MRVLPGTPLPSRFTIIEKFGYFQRAPTSDREFDANCAAEQGANAQENNCIDSLLIAINCN